MQIPAISFNVNEAEVVEFQPIGESTYSPEDNKLRLYPFARLDKDTYARLKDAGFTWAAKQELFVAPMWTPAREDLLIDLCGEIGDEDTSLAERAEVRADRFDGYQEKRAAEALSAKDKVEQITSGIPLGQPILVGHHSERHARKHAEQIENAMRNAVNLWSTSEYWQRRAKGVLRHAEYKDRPEVRARRIKGLEADKRKRERDKAEAEKWLSLWSLPSLTVDMAIRIAAACYLYLPKKDGDRPDFECHQTAYGALTNSFPDLYAPRSLDEVVKTAKSTYPSQIAYADRWISHYMNRISYERALLAEQGAASLLEKKNRQIDAKPPILNYRAPDGIELKNRYRSYETMHLQQVEMTKEEYAKINADYKATNLSADGTHRVRVAMRGVNGLVCVFLTDSKSHDKELDALRRDQVPKGAALQEAAKEAADSLDAADEARFESTLKEDTPANILNVIDEPEHDCEVQKESNADTFKALQDQLKAGVSVVVAPQLFPTPKELACRMASLLDIKHGDVVLEPSAGTGQLVGALGCRMFAPDSIDSRPCRDRQQIHIVEINRKLCQTLENEFPSSVVHCVDFLEFNLDAKLQFDKIIMNPPFANAEDIRHILHARYMLAPGGMLVAICANGPRQQARLRPLVNECGGLWEELPRGTFQEAGTMVGSVLLTLTA